MSIDIIGGVENISSAFGDWMGYVSEVFVCVSLRVFQCERDECFFCESTLHMVQLFFSFPRNSTVISFLIFENIYLFAKAWNNKINMNKGNQRSYQHRIGWCSTSLHAWEKRKKIHHIIYMKMWPLLSKHLTVHVKPRKMILPSSTEEISLLDDEQSFFWGM